MVFCSKESARPWDRGVQKLIWPTHLARVKFGCVEKIKAHCLNCPRPAVHLAGPVLSKPCQKAVARDISAIVKGDLAIRDIDVVSGDGAVGDDAFGAKAGARRI